jgi:hypothetical protein
MKCIKSLIGETCLMHISGKLLIEKLNSYAVAKISKRELVNFSQRNL